MFVDPQAIEFFDKEMVLVKVDAEKDTALAKRFAVSGYPTSVMLGPDGEEVDRIIGYLPTEEFLQTLRDYQQGKGTLADLLQQAETSPTRELFMQIAEKYKYRGGAEEAQRWYQRVIDEGEPGDSLAGEARLALADMHYRAREYDRALEAFQAVKRDYATGYFAETADIYTAVIYRQQGDTARAVAAFKQFLADYPESEDADYARTQIARLTGATEQAQ